MLGARYTSNNIGANDVANSFASSVSSRSLTLKQAMLIASVCEFSGSIAVGSRVADTIRTKIVDPHLFDKAPEVLLLAMMCTILASSVFLTIATRYGMPISTTHSIIGGFIGTATASVGIDKVNWGWRGASQVFVAWVVAPGIAGVLGALIFFVLKKLVLVRRSALRRAFWCIPIFTCITFGALTSMSERIPTPPSSTDKFSVGCLERSSDEKSLDDHDSCYDFLRRSRRFITARLLCHALLVGKDNSTRLDAEVVSCSTRAISAAARSTSANAEWLHEATD